MSEFFKPPNAEPSDASPESSEHVNDPRRGQSADPSGLRLSAAERLGLQLAAMALDVRQGTPDAVERHNDTLLAILAHAWDEGASSNAENVARELYGDGDPITNPYRTTTPEGQPQPPRPARVSNDEARR